MPCSVVSTATPCKCGACRCCWSLGAGSRRSQARLRWRAAQGGPAGSSAEGVPLLQQQQQQQVALQDTYYESRSEALQNVESTIVELGGIFQQLAHMVHLRPCAAALLR